MNNLEFAKELAKRKGISEASAYRYINTVMDTIRQLLAEREEVRIKKNDRRFCPERAG